MTTQSNEQAVTPAGTDAGTTVVDTGGAATTVAASNDDDGIMDLDALANEQANAGSDIEDGSLEGDDPEADAAKAAAKLAEEPAETPEEKAKKLSGSQRAKIREQRLLDDIAARDRELETLRAAKVEATKAPAAGGVDPDMPKEADFNGDYFAFTEARAAYVAGKAAKAAAEGVFKSREDAVAVQRAAEAERVEIADHLERVDAAKAVISDFDQVIEGMKGVNVRSPGLINLIRQSENSAVIAYHLASKPELFDRLDRLPPILQAKEIGRMEKDPAFQLPERKTVTQADPPLSKSKGAAAVVKTQEQQLSSWLDKKYPNRRK